MGESWNAINNGLPSNPCINSFAINGANIFAATNGIGVFLSKDTGTTWNAVNDGFTKLYISSLAISGADIFAGTIGNGVWKRSLSEMIEINELSIKNERLKINVYPNPVNFILSIKYQIPNKSCVQLKVYDILSNELVTLVNSKEEKGEHLINFNVQNLKSGVYFVKIITNEEVGMIKFIKK